jgi:hypothetical protein
MQGWRTVTVIGRDRVMIEKGPGKDGTFREPSWLKDGKQDVFRPGVHAPSARCCGSVHVLTTMNALGTSNRINDNPSSRYLRRSQSAICRPCEQD